MRWDRVQVDRIDDRGDEKHDADIREMLRSITRDASTWLITLDPGDEPDAIRRRVITLARASSTPVDVTAVDGGIRVAPRPGRTASVERRPRAAPVDGDHRFQVGQRVLHPVHGRGRVTASVTGGVVVSFEGAAGILTVPSAHLAARRGKKASGKADARRTTPVRRAPPPTRVDGHTGAPSRPAPPRRVPVSVPDWPVPDDLVMRLAGTGLVLVHQLDGVTVHSTGRRREPLLRIIGSPGRYRASPAIPVRNDAPDTLRAAVELLTTRITVHRARIDAASEALLQTLLECDARLTRARPGGSPSARARIFALPSYRRQPPAIRRSRGPSH